MFSQTVAYALRAMVFLTAHKSTPVSAQVIAAHAYVPERYMSKVMRNLVVAGLVKSRRGPAGGFMLARAPAEISMLSVVEALAPIPRIERCPLANPLHQALCPMHCRLDAAYALIRRVFGQSSLEEVAGDAGFAVCGMLTDPLGSAPKSCSGSCSGNCSRGQDLRGSAIEHAVE